MHVVVRLLAVLLVAPVLAACATKNPPNPWGCAAVGATVGGVGGGFAGAEIVDDDGNEAGLGAGIPIGAIVGAGAGYLACSLIFRPRRRRPRPRRRLLLRPSPWRRSASCCAA